MINIYLKILFIGISLQSFYFYELGLPLVSVLSLVLMFITFLLKGKAFRGDYGANALALCYIITVIWSFIGLFFHETNPDLKRLLSFLLMIIATYTASQLFHRINNESLLRAYLLAHSFFFFLQFIIYYTTGYLIDYVEPITGEQSRAIGGSFELSSGLFARTCGLFTEPGTYVNAIAPFVAIFLRFYKNSLSNKIIFWISMATLPLSFSTFGIVFFIIIIISAEFINSFYRLSALFVSISIAIDYFYNRFVILTDLGQESGLEFRYSFIAQSINIDSVITFFFGRNVLITNVMDRAGIYGAVNDTGLFFFILYFLGPVLTFAIIIVIFYAFLKSDRYSRMALFFIFISKNSIFAPFFPFFVIAAMSGYAKRRTHTPYSHLSEKTSNLKSNFSLLTGNNVKNSLK